MVIISVFNFDLFENPEPLKLYLCKPNRKIICVLNGIDINTSSITKNLNNQYELSFNYNKYINIDDEAVKSNGYDNLNVGMEILVEKIGFFKMQYPPINYDGDKEYKIVTASSIDCELENKDLSGFKINTGEEDSLEYLVTYDDDETENLINDYNGLPYDYIVFYNTFPEQLTSYLNKYSDGIITNSTAIDDINNLCTLIPRIKNRLINDDGNISLVEYVIYSYDANGNISQLELVDFNKRIRELIVFYHKYRKQLSLLDLAIEKCNCNWSIGTIDESLCNKKFQFDIDNQNIYSFLTQNLSSSANCVIDFDIFSKKINATLVDNIGVNTGIFLNKKTLLNSLDITCDESSLCTRYNVSGGDNLDINYVNFGTSRIDDISYYLYAKDSDGKHVYISESLANKYIQYISVREIARSKFIELTKQYNQLLLDINNIEYLVPNDYLSNDWGNCNMDELENLHISFKNMLCVLQSLYKEEYADVGLNPDGSINEDYIVNTVYWHDYFAYINIINQIEAAIDSYASNSNYNDIDNIDIIKKINAYKTEWSLYGTIELQNKLSVYDNTMKVMIDGETILLKDATTKEPYSWNELSSAQKSEFNNDEFNYKYDEYYELWVNRQSCNEYLQTLLLKVEDLKSQLSDIQVTREDIQKIIPIEKYNREILSSLVDLPDIDDVEMFTFSEDEIQTINLLYIDKSYNNDNLFITSLNNIVDTVDIQQELLTDATENLSIDSQPQIIVSGNIENFLAIKDFEYLHKWFDLGNYMMVEYYDNYFIKLRLISYTFNPCLPSDGLSIEWSNFIKSKSKRSDVTYLLGINTSSGSSSSSGSSGSSNGNGFGSDDVNISNTMLNKLLNTEMFGSRVTNIILDTLDVNALTAKSAKFGNLYNGTTTINGKCISTGYIVDSLYNGLNGSINNDKGSVINLDDGRFNFGGGSLKWDGTELNVNGYIDALGGSIGGLTLANDSMYLLNGNSGGSLGSGLIYFGEDGLSLGGNKLVYNTSTDRLTLGSDVKISWNSISDGDSYVTNITQNTIQTMDITASNLNIDKINANGLDGLQIAGFTIADKYLYNTKTSIADSADGVYIGLDGISYSSEGCVYDLDYDSTVCYVGATTNCVMSAKGFTIHSTYANNSVLEDIGYIEVKQSYNTNSLYGSSTTSSIIYPHKITTNSMYANTIYQNGSPLSNIYAPKSHTHSEYAPSSHTHPTYLEISGSTLSGALYFGSSDYYITGNGNGVFNKVTTKNLEITAGNSGITSGAFYLGTIGSSNYYINSSGNARFNTIYEGGTSLSSKYAPYSHSHSSYAPSSHTHSDYAPSNHTHSNYLATSGTTLSGALYLGSSSHYINAYGNGVFNKVTAVDIVYTNSCSKNSAKRYKKDIIYRDYNYWHDKLMSVKPCTFYYINKELSSKQEIGVIAEDLIESNFNELVQFNKNGECETVSYIDLIIPLVSEVQRLNKIIDEIKK